VNLTHYTLRCCGTDAYRLGGQRVCWNAQIRTDRLDEAVWREVERLLHDPARIAAEYERRLDDARRRGTDGPDLAAAEAQAAKLRRSMGRLIDSYAEGLIERSEFEPRIAGFRQRIQGWEAQVEAMRDEAALRSTLSLVIGRLEDFAKRVHDRMSKVDWLMQRELIRTLVKRVEIDQGDVNVVFRIDSTLPTPDPSSPGQNSFLQYCGRVAHEVVGVPRPKYGQKRLARLRRASPEHSKAVVADLRGNAVLAAMPGGSVVHCHPERGGQAGPQHVLVLGHEVIERFGQQPYDLAFRDLDPDPVQQCSEPFRRYLPCACRASTKRRSSEPKPPTIPAGNAASTVSPEGVMQRSRR